VTEAAKAILAAAAEAGIEQVLALTDPDNLRSQAVAARLSMRDRKNFRTHVESGPCRSTHW
jgi:RimJ/RimL family protein N-acetyltransferase